MIEKQEMFQSALSCTNVDSLLTEMNSKVDSKWPVAFLENHQIIHSGVVDLVEFILTLTFIDKCRKLGKSITSLAEYQKRIPTWMTNDSSAVTLTFDEVTGVVIVSTPIRCFGVEMEMFKNKKAIKAKIKC